jgi:hypothetical protein
MDFPITTIRNRYLYEWDRLYEAQVASGPETPKVSPWWAARYQIEQELLSHLPNIAASSAFVIVGGTRSEYGDGWVEVIQDGSDTILHRCIVPNIHLPDCYHPDEEILEQHNLARLCEAACARLARRGFWGLPEELGELVLDGPGSATIWCKHGDRCRRLDVHFADLPLRYWWLKRFARFWLLASPWRLRLAAWCNRWGRRYRSWS